MTPDVEVELQNLRNEIAGVRRRASYLTIGLCAALGLVVASWIVLGSPAKADFVSARGFLVKDPSGKTRAVLGVSSNGIASLALTDEENQPRISIRVDGAGGPQVALRTRDGATTILGAQRLDRPGLYPGERQVEERNAASVVISDTGKGLFWSVP